MKSIDTVREQLANARYTLSRHALHRVTVRNISKAEICEAGATAEMIEYYPDDKYSPSALLLGFTHNRRALHLQVSLLDTDETKIITIYPPDENKWVDYRTRRK